MTPLISLEVPHTLQEFPLNGDSIVFVVGAWEGKHSQFYVDTYDSWVYLFEPQKAKAEFLRQRFLGKQKVMVLPFGLGTTSGAFELSRVGTDRCSFIHRLEGKDLGQSTFEGPYELGQLMEIGTFMEREGLKQISLCLVNCEGYEFYLLPWMVESGIISRFQNLMVQFHLHHEGAERMAEIREMISRTHDVRDDYEPAWIVWTRRTKDE